MNMPIVTEKQQLFYALNEFDSIVLKGCLDNLKSYELVHLDTTLAETINSTRMRKITRIVYDKDEDKQSKFNNLFSSMHSAQSSVILVLKAELAHTDIYIATQKIDESTSAASQDAMNTLVAAMAGNFPGIDISSNLVSSQIENLLSSIRSSDINAIASLVGVPSHKQENSEFFIQGLEKLVEGMRGKSYTAVIKASPVSRAVLEQQEISYQQIYTLLSMFEQQQISMSTNESQALGTSLAKGLTTTITNTIGSSQTQTASTNTSTSTSNSRTQSDYDLKRAIAQGVAGASAGAASGAAIGGVTGAGVGAVPGAIGGAIVGGIGGAINGLLSGSKTETHSTTEGSSESNAMGTSESESNGESKSNTETTSETLTTGTSRSIQVTEKNRTVMSLMQMIDNQLTRLDDCKNYGMWNWGAYFVAESELDARIGAELYSGILRGDKSGFERNAINVWTSMENKQKFHEVQNYVSQLQHPVFVSSAHFTSSSLISTKEMALAMGLPNKSLPGLPVLDAVAFGRSVCTFNQGKGDKLDVGCISNFGQVDKHQRVSLDVNSLTSHVFVTGSTGAGKSNTVYALLDALYTEKNIPFLIIEPAKGEYKAVFGGREGVQVFGTNPKVTPLLRLNPFSFPDSIHVMEHIDRLIEILNAVWPMYASMPAILKEAVEQIYRKSGWDLINSTFEGGTPKFPDFHELLKVLPEIINQSDYSQEMKGNYSGALVTRVKSLTNGYFSTIFSQNELSAEVLFDNPCIVDLSRVGSSETKSMLMGILFLKLHEHRMANADSMNSELRHITVLEEAHNLFRRTSTEQGQESANLQGKSVEMISNALAEMRTYGQGFIIADQAPGLLDLAVIRNTNTKIIMRLPDYDDRNLVGKAANLSDEQIDELARLQTGCAAVYQNNWLEPVLCQFSQFDSSKISPFVNSSVNVKIIDQNKLNLTLSLKQVVQQYLENEQLNQGTANYQRQKTYLHAKVLEKLNLSALLDRVPKTQNFDLWLNCLSNAVSDLLMKDQLSAREQNELIALILDLFAVEKPTNKQFYSEKVFEIRSYEDGLL